MLKLPGTILMSRASGGGTDEIHITVEDAISGCRVLEAYMSLEEFARALTSSFGDAKLEIYTGAPLGKKRETKTEMVPFKYTYGVKESEIRKALKPFEVEGWKASISDMTNHHCRHGEAQRVAFTRFVDA